MNKWDYKVCKISLTFENQLILTHQINKKRIRWSYQYMQEKNFQKNPFIIKLSKVDREWNFLNLVKNIYKNKNITLLLTSYLMMRNWVLPC